MEQYRAALWYRDFVTFAHKKGHAANWETFPHVIHDNLDLFGVTASLNILESGSQPIIGIHTSIQRHTKS